MSLILIQMLQCPHGTSESLLIREKTEEGYPPYAESTCAMRNRSMMPTDEQSWNYTRSHETEFSCEQEAVPRHLLLNNHFRSSMGTTSPESRDHRRLRQAITNEINPFEVYIRGVKSCQNELAPISRLPWELLAAIFSFLPIIAWDEGSFGLLTWICAAHVCRRWRETALNYPRFWNYINFTKLTPIGLVEILSRAKMAPLHLEADSTKWNAEHLEVFGRQLEAHISHTRHLEYRFHDLSRVVMMRLVAPTPTLESLSLSYSRSFPHKLTYTIPDNLFNGTAPSLTSLQLESCDVSWKSPLFKGLRILGIFHPSVKTRPELNDWLDALNEMPQLEELSLRSATPLAPLNSPLTLIPEPSRSATLPSLSRFHISDFSKECALALAHLVLPALTRLHVDVESKSGNGEDVRLLIPYVSRNICGVQDIEPLRSILFSGEGKRAEVVAWTMPDADVNVCNPTTLLSESASARLVFTAMGTYWEHEVVTAIYDAFFTHLRVISVSTFSALNLTQLSKEFWLSQAPRLPLLERVCLVPTAVKAFRDMLAENGPPDGPRLPLLTKLTIFDVTWTSWKTYDFYNMLKERVEQGSPLQSLDLRSCDGSDPCRTKQLFEEVVADVQGLGPLCWSWTIDGWYARRPSEEGRYDDELDWEPWYGWEYDYSEEDD